MAYFRTSLKTVQSIARSSRRFEDVAGFIVLARHGNGLPVANIEPYTISGAGVNSIHEKAGLSEETARGVVERLRESGHIKEAPLEAKGLMRHARWTLVQGALDLDLSHSFVDPLRGSGATAPLKRLRETKLTAGYEKTALNKLSDTELRLDALMLLVAIYRHTSMEAYGGLDPRCAYRKWEIKSQVPNTWGIRWGAEPDEASTAVAFQNFAREAMQHVPKSSGAGKSDDYLWQRFWNAWTNLVKLGLIYEVVALFDASPLTDDKARLLYSVRVNDYHAGAVASEADPSWLRTLEERFGTELAFYTPPLNERGDPEAMWVTLPDKRGALVGIWRARYRASTSDVGAWFSKETEDIESTLERLAA